MYSTEHKIKLQEIIYTSLQDFHISSLNEAANTSKKWKKITNCQTKIPAARQLSKMPYFSYLEFRNASWQPWDSEMKNM